MKYDYQCFLSSLRQVPMPPSPFHLSVFQFQSARTTYVSYKNNIHNNNDKSDNTALGMAKHKQAYCRISLTLLSWYNFYCNAWNKRFEMEINAPKHRFESLNLYTHTHTQHIKQCNNIYAPILCSLTKWLTYVRHPHPCPARSLARSYC